MATARSRKQGPAGTSGARPRGRGEPPVAAVPAKVLDLQRQAGNHAVVQLLERPKPGDAADMALWDDMFRLARKKIASQAYAEAEVLLRGIYSDPKFTTDDSPGVVLNLGLVRHWQAKYDEAIDLYKESLLSTQWGADARPEIMEKLRSARLKQLPDLPGKDQGEEKPDKADTDLWDDMFVLARKKIRARELPAAEKLLLDIYGDPKFRSDISPGVVLNLGLIRHELGDYKRAIDYYEEGMFSSKWGDDEKSQVMERLRKARQKQPPYAATEAEPVKADGADDALWGDLFTLARKKLAAKDLDGAEKLLLAIYNDPKFAIADNAGVVLNLAYVRHVRGDFVGAIERYEESLLGSRWESAKRARVLEQLKAARLHRPPPG